MMRTRNILLIMLALGTVALGATSCGTAVNLARINAAAYTDDLYAVHDTEALREAERLLAEKLAAEKAEQERRIATMVAVANAEADINDLLSDVDIVESPAGAVISTDGGNVNVYNNIYVDDYQSAYARRLQGFTSLTYRMPSSYWDYRYGDAYFLTLAYDPAFYTVMVMGDQVWVEPRYITNMFGSWNNPYYYGYRYGYNPYYFGYSYGYWDYWGWNSPYWGCDPYYHYHCHNHWYGPHYGHPHNPPHPPVDGGHKRPNVSHRPSYGVTAGGGSTSRPSYREQFGGVRDDSRGGTQIAGGTNTPSRGGAVVGSSARPSVSSGRVVGGVDGTRGELAKPTNKNELSGTLSGTTIKPGTSSRPTRGGGVSGVSNSSSRSSRSAVTTRGSSTSSSRSSSVSNSGTSRSSRSSSVGSSSSRSSSSSSSVGSSSSSRSSSSSSSRSSYSSGSSSSSRSSSSSSFSSGSSSSSSRSSYSSGSSSRSSRR